MSKSMHFTGQPLYFQLLKLADKQKIDGISKRGNHDHYVKKLDGYSHFVILLYGVLMRHDSLREIVVGMLFEAHKLQHLGIDTWLNEVLSLKPTIDAAVISLLRSTSGYTTNTGKKRRTTLRYYLPITLI